MCMSMSTHELTHTHINTQMQIHTHKCTHAYTNAHTCTRTHAHTQTHTYLLIDRLDTLMHRKTNMLDSELKITYTPFS